MCGRFLDTHIIAAAAAAAVHRHTNENGKNEIGGSKGDCPCEIRCLIFFLMNIYITYILYM